MALDWASDSPTPVESWRVQMAILTYLVDLFDVYDKVHAGLVDQSHLDTRINTLKLGVMKTANKNGLVLLEKQPQSGVRRLV